MASNAFDNIRLPDEIEQGSTGGPQFYTSVLRMSNGSEARNQNWQDAKCVYDISYGISQDTFYDVITFFRARRGRLRGFRFKDWTDFTAFGQPMVPTDTNYKDYQMVKVYDDGVSSYVRTITRPVVGTIQYYKNGVPIDPTSVALNPKGVLHFNTANLSTDAITADFEFDVPVRFDNDTLGLSVQNFNASSVGSINLTEIFETSALVPA